MDNKKQLSQQEQTRKTLYTVAYWLSVGFLIFYSVIMAIILLIGVLAGTAAAGTTGALVGGGSAIVLVVFYILFLIPTIIFTVFTKKYMIQVGTEQEKSHIVFAIFAIFFMWLVGGILLIIASSNFDNEIAESNN